MGLSEAYEDATVRCAHLQERLAAAERELEEERGWRAALHNDVLGLRASAVDVRLQRDAALALLREVEWGAVDVYAGEADPCCPVCRRWESLTDHAPDCKLAALLEDK